MDRAAAEPAPRDRARAAVAGLTDREREVFAAIAQGRTNAEIASHCT